MIDGYGGGVWGLRGMVVGWMASWMPGGFHGLCVGWHLACCHAETGLSESPIHCMVRVSWKTFYCFCGWMNDLLDGVAWVTW